MSNAPKAVESPPCALSPSHTSSPISNTSLILPPAHPLIFGWLLHVHMLISSPLRPKFNIFPWFFIAPFDAPNNGMVSSHILCPCCASSPTFLLPCLLTVGWFCLSILKRRPPKAVAPPIYLCFGVCCLRPPNKGINNCQFRPAARRLQRTHRELLQHELGSWWALSWWRQSREGRAMAAHFIVVCLCVCDLLLVVDKSNVSYFLPIFVE